MLQDTSPAQLTVVLPLKRFMLLDTCPPDWRALDLYVFRAEDVVFYVGQSYLAFDRVWEHLRHGFKGRSTIGRFILANWPVSLKFSIELLSSQAARFADVAHDLDAAERTLIRQLAPCFNDLLNERPTPLPARYAPPNAQPRCSRSLNKLIHEAQRAVRADEKSAWLSERD